MSLPHFYLQDQVIADQLNQDFVLRLARDDAKHARVLRLAPGEHIAVVDAVQDYFECEIVDFSDDLPLVRIAGHLSGAENRPSVVLVMGLAKGDKVDEVIRHATELGVSAFIPYAAERSIVKLDRKKAASRTERWRAIAKSAAMQSGQPFIPEVSEPLSLAQVCDALKETTAVLVAWEEAPGTQLIADALEKALAAQFCPAEDARVAVVVGPEGGLTQHEVDTLCESARFGFPVTLGESILRAETAGIIAPALVLYELGCLGARKAQAE